MQTLPFTKVEAVGNHFVLIDGRELSGMNWPLLAQRMCEFHCGVGGDGLLAIVPSSRGDFMMRMFNPDGSEDSCGNGLRCSAAYAYINGFCGKDLVIEARDGLRPVQINSAEADSADVTVNMGRPSFKSRDIPAAVESEDMIDYPLEVGDETCYVTCVSVGTPHAVIFAPIEEFWDATPAISPEIEKHPIFPERISVTWCAVDDRETLRVHTWERAVGPTLGCGSGACAALAAASERGFAGTHAKVTSPGGVLEIDWPQCRDIFMSGPARIVYSGEWPLGRFEVL
jgi:diaminopimelate epimerase